MISDIGKYPHITRSRITGDWTDRAHVLPFSRLHLHAKRENGSCRGRPHACTCRRAVCTCPQTGEICLDILKNAWSPAWTLQSTCQAIVALMSDAAPDSPLNCDAGNLLRAGDVRGYNALAHMYTAEHATPM